MKNVTIRPVLNGWVCKVGCSEIVFTDMEAMLRELGRYIEDPEKVEKAYLDNAINKQITGEDCRVEAATGPSVERLQPVGETRSPGDAEDDSGRAR